MHSKTFYTIKFNIRYHNYWPDHKQSVYFKKLFPNLKNVFTFFDIFIYKTILIFHSDVYYTQTLHLLFNFHFIVHYFLFTFPLKPISTRIYKVLLWVFILIFHIFFIIFKFYIKNPNIVSKLLFHQWPNFHLSFSEKKPWDFSLLQVGDDINTSNVFYFFYIITV